jgi:iron(III) transport system substrate-binding protein
MKPPALLLVAALAFLPGGCGRAERVVVVYTSQDQIYAEPLLAEFARKTGIKVLPVFDSESVKTAGLAQRLLAERGHPRADVFWSNEEMMSRQLADLGALETDTWARAGFRTRRLVVNTNLVPLAEAPKRLAELTDPKWAGKIALAYPVYGTTAAHMTALRQKWGDARWRDWCRGLAANRPLIVDGNSMAVRLVGKGEAHIGLTDSDDIAAGIRNGFPIAAMPVTDEFLAVAASVGIVRGAPHRAEAEEFCRFAQSEEAVMRLVQESALESLRADGAALVLDHPAAMDETRALLKTIFARQ